MSLKINLHQKLIGLLRRKSYPKHNHTLNRKWSDFNYILSREEEFNNKFLEQYKEVREIEHQVGRFLNMKNIAEEILTNNYSGDVVEFGTYQGLGLIYLSKLIKRKDVLFIGLDSFEGLPVSSTIWKQGMFKDTSLNFVHNNLYKHNKEARFHLIKGWYNDPTVKEQLCQATKDIILVHFDADLRVSTYDALMCITPFLEDRKKPIYFLFDDWGCHPDEVPEAFYEWVKHYQIKYNFEFEKISSTRFTRYYKLIF